MTPTPTPAAMRAARAVNHEAFNGTQFDAEAVEQCARIIDRAMKELR